MQTLRNGLILAIPLNIISVTFQLHRTYVVRRHLLHLLCLLGIRGRMTRAAHRCLPNEHAKHTRQVTGFFLSVPTTSKEDSTGVTTSPLLLNWDNSLVQLQSTKASVLSIDHKNYSIWGDLDRFILRSARGTLRDVVTADHIHTIYLLLISPLYWEKKSELW